MLHTRFPQSLLLDWYGRLLPFISYIIFYLGNIIVNVICQYCFNTKYNVDDPELQHIIEYINMVFKALLAGEPLGVLSWLRFFPDSKNIKIIKEGVRLRNEYTQLQFDEHRRTLDPNNIRDITDNLLHLSQSEEVCLYLCF